MRLSIFVLVLASGAGCVLSGCTQQGPLIRVTVELHGFARGCVRVTAGPPGDAAPGSSEVHLEQAKQSGLVSVAVFPKAEWGSAVEVVAQAREGECDGALANLDRKTVEVKPTPVDVSLSLAADDADGDGFFALPRGTDCDDGDPGVHRGAAEACNGRDDNCDGAVDEGFDVGLPCDVGSCVGANACNADGTRRCDPNVQWYPDQDGDGRGRADAGGATSCASPAGMAPNHLDCDDGDPAVYAGAREICDGKDNDCSGAADELFFVGQSCQGSACPGSYGCASDGGVRCAGGEGTLGFPDVDLDAFGANGSGGTLVCGALPSGVSAVTGDCDDGNAQVHPGAADLCDGLNNDCSGAADEAYPPAGSPCDAGAACPGAGYACLADGGSACVVVGHQDLDRDQHGAMAGATVTGCFPPDSGWIYNATDCDDSDPFTFQGAVEICDLKDNNCSGAADEGAACPADAGWYSKTTGDAGHDFKAVASTRPGGAVVAGANAALVVLEPSAPTFTDHTANCGAQDWAATWFDPVSDKFYLGGANGDCQVQGRTAATCQGGSACYFTTAQVNVRGLVGFRNGTIETTGLDIFGVMENGQTFVWDGTTTGDDHSLGTVQAQLRGVHGATESRVFAVGCDNNGVEPRIFRYNGGTQWVNQGVQSLPGVVHAPLNAIWMVTDSLGYAVGEQRSVLAWNGAAWSVMAGPTSGNGTLRGVVAWSPTLVFVADDQIHKWDGTQWTTLSPGFNAQIFGLGGSSPADLWAVGADGWIVHWPRTPY